MDCLLDFYRIRSFILASMRWIVRCAPNSLCRSNTIRISALPTPFASPRRTTSPIFNGVKNLTFVGSLHATLQASPDRGLHIGQNHKRLASDQICIVPLLG